MDILNQLQQLEQLLVQPTLVARRQLYLVIQQMLEHTVFPYQYQGLMIHDQYGHPVVGGLEQVILHSTHGQMAPSQLVLLHRLLGGETGLHVAQQQLMARQAIRQINHVLRRLVELHDQHFIYLNREDMRVIRQLDQQFRASPLASYFDVVVLESLLQAPHPDVVPMVSSTRMVSLM
jgi:hypothetical protein